MYGYVTDEEWYIMRVNDLNYIKDLERSIEHFQGRYMKRIFDKDPTLCDQVESIINILGAELKQEKEAYDIRYNRSAKTGEALPKVSFHDVREPSGATTDAA